MRINKYVALATGLSRRAADIAISEGQVRVNSEPATMGQTVATGDQISLNGQQLHLPETTQTIMLNKPVGFVVSREGQGSKTIYDLLPPQLHQLKPVGRLDKDSSGLLLLTNDGTLANTLTHPSYEKTKIYQVELNHPLDDAAFVRLHQGVALADGISHLDVKATGGRGYTVTMHEGRNRQIRRTFVNLGYQVTRLHRTQFGGHVLDDLASGAYKAVD